MAHIPHLQGVSIGTSINVPSSVQASKGAPVKVPLGVQRLMDRAGIVAPQAGEQLSVAHLDVQLTAAKMSAEDRLNLKSGLARLGMVRQGKPISIFD